ncbi:Hypothetical protein HDN1F_34560 [gamma proteobacterium HdN1]|nr:Hypothetical protein HDN1F_34560 [gamma proteobacterium HdN1]
MEKRKFKRLSTRLQVTFSLSQENRLGGVTQYTAVLQDYSRGGVLLIFDPPERDALVAEIRRNLHQAVEIRFAVLDRQHELQGEVVHINTEGIGIRFTKLDPAVFFALTDAARRVALQNASAALIVNRNAGATHDPSKVLPACLDVVQDFCAEVLPVYIASVEAELLAIADQRSARIEPQDAMDALVLFNREGKAFQASVEENYSKAIRAQFQPLGNTKGGELSRTPQTPARLSLVEKGEFEDWLQLKVAVSRVELALQEALTELELRLKAVSGQPLVDGLNPFSPAIFLQALQRFFHKHQMSLSVTGALFRSASTFAIQRFGAMLAEINSLFEECGVLPDLAAAKRQANQVAPTESSTPVKSASERRSNEPAGTGGLGANKDRPSKAPIAAQGRAQTRASSDPKSGVPPRVDGTPDSANEEGGQGQKALRAASEILRAQRVMESSSGPLDVGMDRDDDSSFLPSVDYPQEASREEILRGLTAVANELQHSITESASDEAETVSVSELVLQRLAHLNVVPSTELKESLNMLNSLVGSIADAQKMSMPLREQFSKLQVPLAALRITDPSILDSDQHPVRDLLNQLAALSEPESANYRRNVEIVNETINELLKADPLTEQTIVRLQGPVGDAIEREQRVVERSIHRIVEAYEGRQRVEQVDDYVANELDRIVAGRLIPRIALTVLSAGWRELLRLSLLREGIDSRAWSASVSAFEDLVNMFSIRPVPERGDHFTLPALYKIIESGLTKVARIGGDVASLIAQLREAELQQQPDLVTAPVLKRKAERNEPQGNYPQRQHRKLQRVKVGQWLESGVRDERPQTLQVAWVSPARDKFVLANSQGQRVDELSEEKMLERLTDGDITLLTTHKMGAVEKGLDALIQKIYDRMSEEASRDPLTQVFTRKEFERNLAQCVARAKRNNTQYVVVYIDLVQFKLVNNLYGYDAGDQLLKQAAGRLHDVKLPDSIIGRIGGNEFAIIFTIASEVDAYRSACRIKEVLEGEKYKFTKASHVIQVSVSGCAFDHKTNNVLELLRAVEAAAQIAKEKGLKEVQMVTPGDARFKERDTMMLWAARISKALDQNELRLRAQKIAPVASRHPEWLPHFEILLTIVDENGQHNPPADFILAAEAYGRMVDVDRWVINRTLTWMSENLESLDQFGGFAINLSGHTLNDEGFLDFIFEQLVRHEVPRNKIIFEITETTAVTNLDEAADFIAEMKEIGCRFSLDDFGAGQSSYAYLKKLPVDFIKIDGAFVRKVDVDKVDYALVKSISEMGRFLGKHIVAEFVSDQSKYDTVVGLGVDYLQGWHIAKPVALDDLLESGVVSGSLTS